MLVRLRSSNSLPSGWRLGRVPVAPAFRFGTLIRPSTTYTIVWYRTPA